MRTGRVAMEGSIDGTPRKVVDDLRGIRMTEAGRARKRRPDTAIYIGSGPRRNESEVVKGSVLQKNGNPNREVGGST